MEYALVKVIHILSSTLLFGTGLGSAYYKWMADRSGDISTIASTNRIVVLADWMFTTPTVIIQPLSGFWLVKILGYPLDQLWIVLTIGLYLIAGCCWLPVVWLQIRMRDLAAEANNLNQELPRQYHRYARIWFWLGVPAFIAMTIVFGLMVFKPTI
ncbi:DUF2269 family protein [Motiliproteus sp.]|uniref:DUF2269 family protein n=1 Tax=Motiliproteus sp. TaxID=1898955 RepID=UPI003BABA2BD